MWSLSANPGKVTITSGSDIPLFGYVAAVSRFGEAASLGIDHATAVHVAVFEALAWLDSLAEGVEQRASDADPAAKLIGDYYVRGLRFVRGRTHHHWAQPIYIDKTTGEWLWQGAEILPLPPDRHADPGGQRAYVACLERKPVLKALKRVERLLPSLNS